eukprot:gb/GECG01008625.1/.p1 GENE.gb/GECG01008625.1/~~gb/GECG01008625.1/.p1  ORF type:complete len:363 (+),score=39.49 gb/GECG01008625.1/:1-1089(+)
MESPESAKSTVALLSLLFTASIVADILRDSIVSPGIVLDSEVHSSRTWNLSETNTITSTAADWNSQNSTADRKPPVMGTTVNFEQLWNETRRKLMQGPRKKIRLIHLHKCGGSSFCNMAKANNESRPGGNCNAKDGRVPDLLKRSKAIQHSKMTCNERRNMHSKYSFVGTETMLGVKPCPDTYHYMLPVRDPIDRIRSHIAYHKMRMGDVIRMLKHGSPTAMSFDNKPWGSVREMFDNYFIRMLLGGSTFFAPLHSLKERHLDQAKEKINRSISVIVPLKQQVPEAKNCLEAVTRWKKTTLSHSRKTSRPKSGTKEELDYIRKVNSLDLQLYQYALNLSKTCRERLISRTLKQPVQNAVSLQ